MRAIVYPVLLIGGFAVMTTAPVPALAAPCGSNAGGFNAWLKDFKVKAVKQGISQKTVNRALKGVSYDRQVIRLDRSQRSFKMSFKQFYAKRVNRALIARGRKLMKRHAGTLARIEKRYGVPPSIIVAIWGLETHYGSYKGSPRSIMRSLATLSYDCRRSAFFTAELLAALKIVDRRYISLSLMRGAWAGEIGQTQFLPTVYVKYAVDFNGDGRRDLFRSVPDVLASTANALRGLGWQRGGAWGEGSANQAALRRWNRAGVYYRTIGKFARQLEGS